MRGTLGMVLMALAMAAAAQSPPPGRGELLYTTHCQGCHTTQVHWRERKLASDWSGLAAQVERWQRNANLGWSGDDVEAVARYLNHRFYRFPAPDGKVGGAAGPPRG